MATRVTRNVDEELARELEGPAQILPPHVESMGVGTGAYTVSFPGAMARVTVDSIRMGRDGLRGEVTVEVGPFGDGDFRIVGGPGRMELNSMSQRETWERRLRKRWSGTDWEQVMDRFCAAILQAEKRLDKPAIKLRDAVRPATTGMIMDPLVEARLPTLWYGDGGSAKSLLAMAAALSIHEGVPMIGTFRPAHKLRVLYVDFELDEWPHYDRMRRLVVAGDDWATTDLPDIDYLDCRGGTIVNQIERIQAAARDCHSEFVVIDSVSYAAEGPLNDDETARLYYQKLASLALPTLSLGHIAKNANPDYPFGSVHWKNLCRLAWYFQVCESDDPDALNLKLTNKKANLGSTPKPIGLTIHFNPRSIQISNAAADAMSTPDLPDWQKIAQAIRREGEAMTYVALALATGLDDKVIRARVSGRKETFVVLKETPVRVGLATQRGFES